MGVFIRTLRQALVPNLTMLENMSLADNKGKPFGLGRGVNKARENFYKEQLSILGLGLENKMNVKLGALSGGQRQAANADYGNADSD